MKKIGLVLFCITFFLPQLLTAQTKPRLAVLPFTGGTGSDGNTISLLLANQSVIRTVFTVVPRNDSAVSAIMKEHDTQRSGLTDSDTISELGKQLNADYVVAGHIQKLGAKNLVSITIINVESFRQISGDSCAYGTIDEVRTYLPSMANRISKASSTRNSAAPSLAVFPFDIPPDVNVSDAEILAQLLATEVANTGKYAVLPRTKTIETVMKEQNIQRSGLTDINSIRLIAKATNADYVLSGYVLKLGATNFFAAQILNVETGAMIDSTTGVGAGDIEYKELGDGLLLMPQLAEMLTHAKAEAARVEQAKLAAEQLKAEVERDKAKADAEAERARIAAAYKKANPYQIGDRGPAGGIVFYDKGGKSDGWRYLEAAPADLPNALEWGGYKKNISGTETGIGSGKANTLAIIDRLKNKDSRVKANYAANVARQYILNGYTDWFLPSKDELNLMYKNLKVKKLGGFGDGWYWSSSQHLANSAWYQSFSDGNQYAYDGDYSNYCIYKANSNSVRVVRAF